MFGIKKKIESEVEARIDDTANSLAFEALQEVVDTQIIDEKGNVNAESTLEAIKQKAQMTLDFIVNLTVASEEELPKSGKEQKHYGRK